MTTATGPVRVTRGTQAQVDAVPATKPGRIISSIKDSDPTKRRLYVEMYDGTRKGLAWQSELNGVASTDVATTTANGLMSATDKTKLDGLGSGLGSPTYYASVSTSSPWYAPAAGWYLIQGIEGTFPQNQIGYPGQAIRYLSKNESITPYGGATWSMIIYKF